MFGTTANDKAKASFDLMAIKIYFHSPWNWEKKSLRLNKKMYEKFTI